MCISKNAKVSCLANPLSTGLVLLVLLGLTFSTGFAQTTVNVSSLAELRLAVQESDQHIIMKPGNYTVLDCIVEGYSMPTDGEVINCRGNAAYGPLIYIHPADHFHKVEAAHRSTIELELLPSPHAVGNHVMAAIRGTNNIFKLTQTESPIDALLRPIVVGYYSRFELLTTDFPGVPEGYEENYEKNKVNYEAAKNTILNETEYPVMLGERSEHNNITSHGKVIDYGKNNSILKIRDLPSGKN